MGRPPPAYLSNANPKKSSNIVHPCYLFRREREKRTNERTVPEIFGRPRVPPRPPRGSWDPLAFADGGGPAHDVIACGPSARVELDF